LDDNQKGSPSARLFAKMINKFNILYKVWNFDTLTFNQTTLNKLPGIGAEFGSDHYKGLVTEGGDNNSGIVRESLG
jgi:hypothetical protein